MSSDFNKASPGNEDTTHKQDWEIVPVSDVRLTAEEAEERFMSFVEQEYPEELHWLFAEIRKMATKEGVQSPSRLFGDLDKCEQGCFRGYGSTTDIRWKRIEVYLGKLGLLNIEQSE